MCIKGESAWSDVVPKKPSSFCHRHLVAEWLGDCKEFDENPAVKVGGFVIHQKI